MDKRKQLNKFLKNCPLLIMIVASVIIVTIFSIVQVAEGKYPLKWGLEHPIFSAVMTGEKVYEDPYVSSGVKTLGFDFEATMNDAEKEIYPTEYKTVEMRVARSKFYEDNDQIALTTPYPYYVTVNNSYFDDAVFIGDSRVEGLKNYGGFDSSDFLSKTGLMLYGCLDETVETDDGNKTIRQALTDKQYGKIYIMIGINELADMDPQYWGNAYKENIEEIQELQPNAIIFIQGIMHVSTAYSNANDSYNNDNIDDRNCEIAALANGVDIFYLDVNTELDDENGGVTESYTWDGIHLQAEYYSIWADFLKAHGVDKAADAAREAERLKAEAEDSEGGTSEDDTATEDTAEDGGNASD